jgi:hypothetical protein
MAGTSILWADQSTIWALRHRTTEPDPGRTIERSFRPSSLVISLIATRSATAILCATDRQSGGRAPPTLPVTALVDREGYLDDLVVGHFQAFRILELEVGAQAFTQDGDVPIPDLSFKNLPSV